MGATAAHRVLEKVVDGTCTQVWVWMNNKYRRRMNGGEGYITTKISQRRGIEKKGEKKKRKMIAVLRTLESSRIETLKNQEGEFILGPSPRINFYPFSTHSAIPLPYGLVRLL